MELIWTRAGGLVRRAGRATVLLALLAGLTAGVAMAMVAAGRRTATVYDRFATFSDPPELLANFCPPGVTPAGESDLEQCFLYDPKPERDAIAVLPEVEAAARGGFRGVTMAPADDPDDRTLASSLAMYEPGVPSTAGRYRVVEGDDATGPHEIVISENLADQGFEAGDEVVLTFWGEGELGRFTEGAELHGPEVEVRIAGVGRALTDVTAAQVGFSANDDFLVYTGPGLAQATDEAEEFFGILIEATDDDADAASGAIHEAFPDQSFNLVPALGDDEIAPGRDAIRYEARAVLTLGLVVAIVVAAFVAQLLARQSRREWDDGPVLRALGVTRGTAVACALARSLAISVPAVTIAVVTSIALSPLGPVGMGRRAEIDAGVKVDLPVLVLGGVAVGVVITLAIAAPVLRGRVLRPAPAVAPVRTAARSIAVPPVLSAARHLARRGRSGSLVEEGTALVGVAAAVAVGVAAVSLTASFDDLIDSPARFGAPWDLSVGSSAIGNSPVEVLASNEEVSSQVDQAALITGVDMQLGDEVAWVQAFAPVEGTDVLSPTIIEGRAPTDDGEIAVGGITLRLIDRDVGDMLTVTSATTGEEYEMEIVGVAVINDTFEASPGRGAVVTPEFIVSAAPEAQGDPLVLSLEDGADVDVVADELRAGYDGPVQQPVQQAAVRNVGRIRYLPFVMAAVVAVLAVASLLHALVLWVGRNRRPLGVLKGLGFTRRQVGSTVVLRATAFALLALVTAVPLGVFVGRQGWSLVAEGLGVPSVPIVPVVPVVAVVVGTLVVTNLVGAYPAWRAARLRTAVALRSE